MNTTAEPGPAAAKAPHAEARCFLDNQGIDVWKRIAEQESLEPVVEAKTGAGS